MYTWGCITLDDDYNKPKEKSSCGGFMVKSVHRNGSSRKRSLPNKMVSITLNKKLSLPSEVTLPSFLSALKLIFLLEISWRAHLPPPPFPFFYPCLSQNDYGYVC